MARVGEGPSFRRPASAAAAVVATMDELQAEAGAAAPAKRERRPAAPRKRSAKPKAPANQPADSAGPSRRGFEADLVQVAVMFRSSVLQALEQTVEQLRADGTRVGLAAVVRAAVEGLPTTPEATLEAARQERAAARSAAVGGRGVERNVRVYAHQRAELERAAAQLAARRVQGAQSLLVNGAARRLVEQGPQAVTAAVDALDTRREEASLADAPGQRAA